MEDDFGSDADFVALAQAVERPSAPAAAPAAAASSGAKVVQPTPRALPQRQAPSAIQVSTRQRGNPLLTHITALPWEYADIEPDYVVGSTTCVLYLSLKYHRLHPEYVYSRIRALGRHRYTLRVLLVTVDVDNHEEPLRELAKTGLVNDLTLMLNWSAREAARYLEAYRALEHASPAPIRGHAAIGYGDKLVDFVTTPRGINRADAVGLVGAFGSVRAAVNAPPHDLAGVQGWGEVKVRRWVGAVNEPFRTARAGRKDGSKPTTAFVSASAPRTLSVAAASVPPNPEVEEDEDALLAFADAERPETTVPEAPPPKRPRRDEPELDVGIAAALARYRKD